MNFFSHFYLFIISAYNLIPTDVARLQNIKGPDEIFREQLEKSKSVIAVLGSNVSSHGTYDRSPKAKFLAKGGDPKEFTYSFPHSIGSLEKLENSVKGLGSISFLDQTDGIIRSLPLIVRFKNKLYPGILTSLGDGYRVDSVFFDKMISLNRAEGYNGEVLFYYETIKDAKIPIYKY